MYTSTNYLLYKYVGNVVCPFKVIFCGIFGVRFKGLWLIGRVVPTPSTEMLKDDGVNWSLWTIFPCTSWNVLHLDCTGQFSRKKNEKRSLVSWRENFPVYTEKTALRVGSCWGFWALSACIHTSTAGVFFLLGQRNFKKWFHAGSPRTQRPSRRAGKARCVGRVRFRDKNQNQKVIVCFLTPTFLVICIFSWLEISMKV